MLMTPLPHQLAGAEFLAARNYALLADAPRVGKTGTAIMAADKIGAKRILVITTASGRSVWTRAWKDWSYVPRDVVTHYTGEWTSELQFANVAIVGWSVIQKVKSIEGWDLIIVDESHYAKSVEVKRTQTLYGTFRGATRGWGLVDLASRVWCLTGTPIPNAPNDLYPMMRALCADRLAATYEREFWFEGRPGTEGGTYGPDVTRYDAFLNRYCIVKKKRLSRWNSIDVVVGGRNEAELKARLDGFWLRRTQADVGITKPIFDLLPIHITAKQRAQIEAAVPEAADILAAAETGKTKSLDIHLGTLRRLTGAVKVEGVAQAVKDEFDGGLDKVVLMAWHRDVLDALEEALAQYGTVRVDGATSPDNRYMAQYRFQTSADTRVFLGQILATGEAIDLSAAAELIFVESSFVPKDMAQAALRITNHGQKRQPRVRVAALEGSIDEALQSILVRKVATNKEIIG
jgi:SWI/SNF-related matrix-associated actin-dependent regulator of chromatin subfamily A-like protein 1